MDLVVISLAILFLVQILLIADLHRRLTKVEELMEDVSLDITVYERMKSQENSYSKPSITTVGKWKK